MVEDTIEYGSTFNYVEQGLCITEPTPIIIIGECNICFEHNLTTKCRICSFKVCIDCHIKMYPSTDHYVEEICCVCKNPFIDNDIHDRHRYDYDHEYYNSLTIITSHQTR